MTPADPLARLVAAVMGTGIKVPNIEEPPGWTCIRERDWREIVAATRAAQAARPVEGAAFDPGGLNRLPCSCWIRGHSREHERALLAAISPAPTPTDAHVVPAPTGPQNVEFRPQGDAKGRITSHLPTDADVEALIETYIAADEKVLRYAAMLGVGPDGEGPGESRTGAVQAVSERIDKARAALAALRARREGA